MRIKFNKKLLVLLIFIHILLASYFFRFYFSFIITNDAITESQTTIPRISSKYSIKQLSSLITIVLREFDLFENDVISTAQSFGNLFTSASIWILYNERPYPPLDNKLKPNLLRHIQFFDLTPNLTGNVNFLSKIQTRYMLFVPDSTRISSRHVLQEMVHELDKNDGSIVTIPVLSHQSSSLKCYLIHLNSRKWTLKYISSPKGNICNAIIGKHLILVETETLKRLYDPFLLPFPSSLYIQSAVQNVKVKILPGLFLYEGKVIMKSHHAQLRKNQINNDFFKKFCKLFKIKQVIKENGTSEWYGCSKQTPRCFGPVLENTPSYLYENKWTPPCCLANLRKTAAYVFRMLSNAGVRYWLEAGSLLGAMRREDILPWDYNVDIGYYSEDLNRCKMLKRSSNRPFVDKQGFYWEKATEGNFFRVHFSVTNRIYVNLFPFFSKNGTMVKDSWFTSHKNMDFPESFLHPMASIEFAGMSVPCPNNIREFLELKYGKGCIENPEYPNPSRLDFKADLE